MSENIEIQTLRSARSKKENPDSVNAVDRAIRVLDALCRSDSPLGVSTLAAELNLPKVTTFRILTTLLEGGLIDKNEDDTYRLGLSLIRYGKKVQSETDFISIAAPFLKKLGEETGETVNLGILQEMDVFNVYSVPGESSILSSRLLPLSPLYCSSIGKIFLSAMPEHEVKAYFQTNLLKRTMNSRITFEEFMIERGEIVETHLSFDREEYEYGLSCIASPLFGSQGSILSAVSISGPTSRLKIKGFDALSAHTAAAAAQISEAYEKACL